MVAHRLGPPGPRRALEHRCRPRCATRAARRRGEDPWGVALASIAGVTGVALLRYEGELRASFPIEWISPLARHKNLVEAGAPLIQGRSALLFAAGIAAAIILILARGERRRPTLPRSLIASAGIFALGLAAFALTRDAAHDARAPLPFLDGALTSQLELGEISVRSSRWGSTARRAYRSSRRSRSAATAPRVALRASAEPR